MGLFRRDSGKVWWLDITLPNGKRLRESTKTTSKQLATEYHDKVKAEKWKEHRLGVKPDVPFTQAADTYLHEKKRRAERDYIRILDWWKEEFSGLMLRQITQELILSTIAKKADTSAANRNRYLALLRGCLRLAHLKHQWIDSVPKVFMYEEPKERVRWLTADEVTRLLDAVPDHLRDMVVLSLATGLRQKNVVKLRWSQVDMTRKVLMFTADDMKGKKALTIPLSDAALDAIRRQTGKHEEFVFTRKGKPVLKANSESWRKSLAKVGIEDFRWHDLRHTWATTMVQNGVPEGVIQSLGAWETPAMVKKYAHHSAESTRPYVGVADTVLAGARFTSQQAANQPLRLVVNGSK